MGKGLIIAAVIVAIIAIAFAYVMYVKKRFIAEIHALAVSLASTTSLAGQFITKYAQGKGGAALASLDVLGAAARVAAADATTVKLAEVAVLAFTWSIPAASKALTALGGTLAVSPIQQKEFKHFIVLLDLSEAELRAAVARA
jgi:hypothetical protein